MNTVTQEVACETCISRITNLRLVVGLVGLVLGVIAAIGLLVEGHASFGTDSNVVWGLPVATYVFFVLTSTGLTFVASLAMVFGLKEFYPIAKRCIWGAIATLVTGFIALGLEIGNPLRMLWAIPTNFATSSPMWWMGLFYTSYLVFLIWKFVLVHKGDWSSRQSRVVGILSFVTVIIAHATLGSVFGMMAMRPFWFGGMVPVYFLITAALSGLAFIMLFINLDYGMNQANMSDGTRRAMRRDMPAIFGLVLGLVLVFTVARTATGLWSNVSEINIPMQYIVSSVWYQAEIWLGMVVPLVLMLSPYRTNPKVQTVAGLLVILALFIGRYEYVVGGQLVPLFKGAWYDDLIPYFPTVTELGVVLMAASIGLLLYAFGDKKLNLGASPNA